jgi:hypothetical protein
MATKAKAKPTAAGAAASKKPAASDKPTTGAKKPATKAAAKPAKETGTAVAVRNAGGALMDATAIQAKLREQAAAMAERTTPPGGIKIQVTQDKKFKLPNGETVTELLACVVDFRTTHNFYPGAYDRNNIVPPVCFAVGQNPRMMIPVSDSPEVQAETCQVCPNNQFGSSPTGEGKACKNTRLLALLPPNEAGDDVDGEADIWLLGVSPTALRAWDAYVQTLSRQHQLPPVAFLVTIGFNDAVDYAQLTFSNPVPLSDEGIAAAMSRQDEAGELLEQLPDWAGFAASGGSAPKNQGRKAAPVKNVGAKAPARGGMAARR